MAADITLDGTQYPARITITGEAGRRTAWIHDGCCDVSVQLTPVTARALAEQLLADQSGGAFAKSGIGGGERMQVSPELEAPPHRSQAGR